MKIILVLLDGLGDRSYEILGNRTPLEAAETSNLNRLASLGGNGLLHASMQGQCLPSETAHFLLFGYDYRDFPGRGLLEAVGYGVNFDDDDVLTLAHFSGVTWRDGKPVFTHGRKDITADYEELGRLFAALSTFETCGIRFRLRQTRQNDAILIASGDASPYVSDADPMILGHSMMKALPLPGNPEPEKAARTAKALNEYVEYCHRALTGPELEPPWPVNYLGIQRSGRRTALTPFDRLWNLKSKMIASGAVYGGLAREIGMEFAAVRDSENPGDDLKERIRTALSDPDHDFVHVHTKAPDEAAHEQDPELKKNVIEQLDRGMDELAAAVESGEDLLAVVTADHSTPSMSPMVHSGEPVPVIMAGPKVRRDRVRTFDEIAAASGCLGMLRGKELMLMALNFADKGSLLTQFFF